MERVAFLVERTGQRIDCLLNPEKVIFRRQSGVKRRTLLGHPIGDAAWSDDLLVTGGGGLTELQLDLLFDTSLLPSSAPVTDAQQLTAPFRELTEQAVDARGLRESRLARFVWGKTWNMLGLVTAISERFECFLPDGSPQRCWMRLCFLRVPEPGAAGGNTPQEVVRAGDELPAQSVSGQVLFAPAAPATETGDAEARGPVRMDQVAYELSGRASAWREVAAASGIDDPTAVPAGTRFRAPRDEQGREEAQ